MYMDMLMGVRRGGLNIMPGGIMLNGQVKKKGQPRTAGPTLDAYCVMEKYPLRVK